MKKIFILFFSLLIQCVLAQTDFTHLSLHIKLDTINEEVFGEVTHKFLAKTGTDSIGINAINMNFKEVLLNNRAISYQYNKKVLWFDGKLVQKDTNILSIQYSCIPRKGLFFIGWNDKTGLSKRQIWTQGQGIDHRHWIPHKDDQTDKVIFDVLVDFSPAYNIISNGLLVDSLKLNENLNRWHYSMQEPMSSYLIALMIGKYAEEKSESASGIPLYQYYYPERKADYPLYYYKNEEIFDFLEKEIGEAYVWENYKQVPVQNFHHGAMENTTATLFGDFFLVDSIANHDKNYTYVNAHELAHHWFGNLVTADGADNHWLHEGFATYYQWLSEKNLYGKDYFDWMRYKEAELVFTASKTDTVILGSGKAGSYRFYQKGAWVLYMLEDYLGEEVFKKSIQDYIKTYAYKVVTTDSLQKVIKNHTDKDISKFFKTWVYGIGEPNIMLKSHYKKGVLQVQAINMHQWLFKAKTSIDIDVFYKDASVKTYALSISDEDTIQESIAVGKGVIYWIVNPNMKTLAYVEEEKPFEIWQYQYENSPHIIDKYAAVKYIYSDDKKQLINFLENIVYDKSAFHAVRAMALEKLHELEVNNFEDLLMVAFISKDIELQKRAVDLVGTHKSDELVSVLITLRNAPSYVLREKIIHKLIDIESLDKNKWLYDKLYEEQPGIPGAKVYITALTYRVLLYKDTLALLAIEKYASSGFDFFTRINAINALSVLNHFNKTALENTLDAYFDSNWKLRGTARNLLLQYASVDERKEEVIHYIQKNSTSWKAKENLALEKLFNISIE